MEGSARVPGAHRPRPGALRRSALLDVRGRHHSRIAERVLTERELNRALLARQLLLERSPLSIRDAVERLGGIQNQYAPNAYIRLATCLEKFRRDDLTRALVRGTVVQGTLMRSTIHVVSAREYWHFAMGVRRAIREWAEKADTRAGRKGMARRENLLRAQLAGGPKSVKELGELGKGFVGLWSELVRVPPSGTWERRRADLLALAEHWVGSPDTSEAAGLEHLVRRYLRGFGPASLKDVSSWAGVPVADLVTPAARLPLRRFRDDRGRELIDLPRAPLPPADTPAPVRLLPTWDASLLVHARRTGVLPEEYRPLVFSNKNPPSVPTFLVDGRVAGQWRFDGRRIELEPFGRLTRATQRELREEAVRMAAILA